MTRLTLVMLIALAFFAYAPPVLKNEDIFADVSRDIDWSRLHHDHKNLSRIQRMDANYQLYQTQNYWMFILLVLVMDASGNCTGTLMKTSLVDSSQSTYDP